MKALKVQLLGILATVCLFNSMSASAHDTTPNNVRELTTAEVELLGSDIDNNGVRDDIQEYLEGRYSGYPIIRHEMERYSKAIDKLMIGRTIKERLEAYQEMDSTKYCAFGWGYTEDEFTVHVSQIYDMQVNTPQRILAASRAERSMRGFERPQYRTKPYKEYCHQEKSSQN
ncbi:hypothetical protein P3602_21145 [Vibrio parahaemolyticus]|nr:MULTISPECIES: hypothetical protein [Vibrio]MCA2421844.1 hypothetical protein [Vibrio alginolyticus]MCA2446548.1 hypothetical protein [Vibrio alginolyticus]MCR9821594.1 hypothetical protein [Vibrio parahaemolyticus]MDF5108323.1 hypothetical protein [Vibrio parahaemolyticus]MDF5143229.1 hypothetical protein [Vibrio parahaemolyticus]